MHHAVLMNIGAVKIPHLMSNMWFCQSWGGLFGKHVSL